jgi:hypothetical protein
MMRAALFVLALSASAQTVSNIRFDGVGDSSARTIFDAAVSFNGLRVRYGTTDCSGGSGGTLQQNGTAPSTFSLFGMTANISGLAPSTQYYVCPEISTDGGMTWSSGISATVTTLARTRILPLPPTPVSVVFPAQTGTIRTVAVDCSNFQTNINAAQPGDTIVVPAQTVCTGNYVLPMAPEAKTFVPAGVRTSDSRITITAHGFTENQEVRISGGQANGSCLPGMLIYPYGLNCDKGGGWRKGARYYVHVVDANHVQLLGAPGGSPVVPGFIAFTANPANDVITFKPDWRTPAGFASASGGATIPANNQVQFRSTGTLPGGLAVDTNYYLSSACPANGNAACITQVSASSGGSAINITDAGTGAHTIVDQGTGPFYIIPAPTNSSWIVIRSNGNLPPEGARTGPQFDAAGFHLRQLTPLSTNPLLSTGILTHNWRISGAIFDTATNSDYLTTTDPRAYCGTLTTGIDSSNIILDGVRVQGPGYPNRFGCSTAIILDGTNVGFINSDLRGMDYWHPWFSGLTAATHGPTQATLTSGTGHGGVFTTTTTATTTVTLTGGSASGTGYVFMAMDGSLRVVLPSGLTGTCSSAGTTCTVSNSGNPTWPADGNGRTAALKLATITVASGTITAAANADAFSSANDTEGTQAIIAGNGPGPYVIDNNFMSGTGIPLHFDDSGGPFLSRGDYNVTRNTFDQPASEMAGGPKSNGLRYGNRQPLEWKGGNRIKVDGNIFTGSFAEDNPVSVSIAITPRSQGYVTDVDVTNNTFLNSVGGVTIASPIDSNAPVSKPAARQRFKNNLFLSLNGWAGSVMPIATGHGWPFYGGYGTEDITIDHNTSYDNRGSAPTFLHWIQSPAGGVSITNNIYFYTGDAPAFQGENVSTCGGGVADKDLMDCAFTSGPGTASYTFSRNLLVPSWSSTSAPSGFVGASTVQSAFPAPLVNYIPNGNSVAANLALIKFVSSAAVGRDVRLAAASPYVHNAGDGAPVGANLEQLQQVQGTISQLRASNPTPNGATISAFTPDAAASCWVGYGTTQNAATWTWTNPDTSPTRQRNIVLNGLTGRTQYFYSMVCQRTALPSIQTFRTP